MNHPHRSFQKTLRNTLLFVPILAIASACISRYQEIIPNSLVLEWNPSLAVPLIKTNVNLGDFLDRVDSTGFVGVGDNDIITFFFEESVASDVAGDLYTIPDQSITRTVQSEASPVLPFPIDTTITFQETFEADITTDQGERLDSIVLRSGNLLTELRIENPSTEGTIELIVPAVKDGNRDTLRQVFTWVDNGSPILRSSSSTLDDAVLALTNSGGARNKFVFVANVTLVYRQATVIGGARADIDFSLTELDWRGVYGNLTSRTVPTASGSVPFDVFGNIDEGLFRLSNPTMRLILENSFGLEVGLDLSNIIATDRNGTQFPLEGAITEELQILESPDFTQIGESITTTISIDTSTSNFPDLLAILPEQLDYAVEGSINPNGDTTNFILDDSQITGTLEVEVPLAGAISGLTYSESFDVDFQDSLDVAGSTAIIRVGYTNGLPLDLRAQLYMQDAEGNVLDSLIGQQDFIMGASVAANGDVTSAQEGELLIDINQGKLDNLRNTTQLVLDVGLSTTNGGTENVNLKPEYGIEINVSIQADLNLTATVGNSGN